MPSVFFLPFLPSPSFPSLSSLLPSLPLSLPFSLPPPPQVVQRVSEPGFMCRKHTLFKSKDHPLQKIDTIYARPVLAEDEGPRSYALWTWARQDTERNFSIVDVRKGVFNLPEKHAPGGRVYAMTATGEVEKRIWIGTAVSWCLFMEDSPFYHIAVPVQGSL